MSMQKVFACDLCREKTDPVELYGLRFKNLHEFKIDWPQTTGGVHVCKVCLRQLEEEISKLKLYEVSGK